MPSTIIPGRTSTRTLPSTGARANSARPAAISAMPIASGPRMPKRITIRAERPSENAPMIRFDGRNVRPTSSGL